MREPVTTYAAQQSQWVSSLYRADASLSRGMLVYQSNMLALAKSSLRSAYPVLTVILGDESMDALACAHWLHSPPQRGDVHHWGGELALYMQQPEQQVQLSDWPWLADVARCEWALHRLAFAPDGIAQPHTLQQLIDHEPQFLHLVLAPGWQVLHSTWPVQDIVNTHRQLPDDEQQRAACVQELWARVEGASSSVVPHPMLLWREGWQPRVRECLAGEAEFLSALEQGANLQTALDSSPHFAFDQWLPLAVQSGLLHQIVYIKNTGDTP